MQHAWRQSRTKQAWRWSTLLALGAACLLRAPAARAQLEGDPGDPAGDATSHLIHDETAAPADETETWSGLDRVLGSAQWFWVQGKAMPGFELGLGRERFELDVELSFVTLMERSSELDGRWVGNQLGVFAMFSPVRERWVDVSLGLGGDFYLLWGVHSDASEVALAPRAVLRLWPSEQLAISVSARSYVLHGSGLELGTARDGSASLPLLLSTGITWRFF